MSNHTSSSISVIEKKAKPVFLIPLLTIILAAGVVRSSIHSTATLAGRAGRPDAHLSGRGSAAHGDRIFFVCAYSPVVGHVVGIEVAVMACQLSGIWSWLDVDSQLGEAGRLESGSPPEWPLQ